MTFCATYRRYSHRRPSDGTLTHSVLPSYSDANRAAHPPNMMNGGHKTATGYRTLAGVVDDTLRRTMVQVKVRDLALIQLPLNTYNSREEV